MENYLVVRAEEERRRKRTIWTTDNLKSVLELWIQSLPYMTERMNSWLYLLFSPCSRLASSRWPATWSPAASRTSTRRWPGRLTDDHEDDHCHSGDDCHSEDDHDDDYCHSDDDCRSVKMIIALTDDHDDDHCHSDDDCRSDWWSRWWVLPFWWLWWRSLTRRSIVVNTKPL